MLDYSGEGEGIQQAASLRVVVVEDMWEILMGLHDQVCRVGWNQNEGLLNSAWQSRASTSDTALPRS